MKRGREQTDEACAALTPGRGSAYVRVEIGGISRHGIRRIYEVIERVLDQETLRRNVADSSLELDSEEDEVEGSRGNDRTDANMNGSMAHSDTKYKRLKASQAGGSSQPVQLMFEPGFVIDRAGSQEIPRDIQNPHSWEAWSIPKYEIIAPRINDRQNVIGSTSKNRLKPAVSATKYAPADHQSRQARGRFYKGWSTSNRAFTPGELSAELRSALGMSQDKDSKVPWLDRMQRYGFPPAFVMESMKGRLNRKSLKLLDGESGDGEDKDGTDEGEQNRTLEIANASECALQLFEFPLYLQPGNGLHHPGFKALRNHSTRSTASCPGSEDGDCGLYVSPCPITVDRDRRDRETN